MAMALPKGMFRYPKSGSLWPRKDDVYVLKRFPELKYPTD